MNEFKAQVHATVEYGFPLIEGKWYELFWRTSHRSVGVFQYVGYEEYAGTGRHRFKTDDQMIGLAAGRLRESRFYVRETLN